MLYFNQTIRVILIVHPCRISFWPLNFKIFIFWNIFQNVSFYYYRLTPKIIIRENKKNIYNTRKYINKIYNSSPLMWELRPHFNHYRFSLWWRRRIIKGLFISPLNLFDFFFVFSLYQILPFKYPLKGLFISPLNITCRLLSGLTWLV